MSEQESSEVGARIREYRQQRGLSLRALAELCSLSPNTISLVERGLTSPSVSTLQQLATALGVPITSFFSEPVERVQVLVTRGDERIRSGSASVVLESLGYGLREQACDPFIVTLKPGASSGPKLMIHTGHELIMCIRGELEYEIGGQLYRLKSGDSLLFHADQPHRWRNLGGDEAEFLLIMQVVEDRHEAVDQHLHP